ncbi:MAG: lipoyl(octanoyl) transferase LipB, partial [Proteobacteria bacterium]|nr:lipoyl(octanoyl) transferase LipB [Pseudomonadota bacterium]
SHYNVSAMRKQKAPGVYVDDKKIASLGLRIRKGCSFHGLAFNIDMDLEPFTRINPCGFSDLEVTQLAAFDKTASINQVKQQLIAAFCENLNFKTIQ